MTLVLTNAQLRLLCHIVATTLDDVQDGSPFEYGEESKIISLLETVKGAYHNSTKLPERTNQ